MSGLVLDYVVLSKYCAECTLVIDKLTGKERKVWLDAHHVVCDCNHTGYSEAMETEVAKMSWKRSEEVGGFRYTGLVGDGDAAVMDALSTISPYPVCKEECINHVAKCTFMILHICMSWSQTATKVLKATNRTKLSKGKPKFTLP